MRRECMAGRGGGGAAKSLEMGSRTWEVWVLCAGWFLQVLNSPRGKGRPEPGTKPPGTGLKGLVRMAACTCPSTGRWRRGEG